MKKLLFGIAFFTGSMLFSSLTVQAEEDIMRWQQMFCRDGSGGMYEICYYSGDGNLCSTHGAKTRDCDPETDPILPE